MSDTVAVAGDGVQLFYAAIILLVLTWITVSMRVCVRLWRKVLGMDDYLMIAGLVSILPAHHMRMELIPTGSVLGNGVSLHSCLLLRFGPEGGSFTSCYYIERN